MSEKMDEALEQATKDLLALSPEEFRKQLDAHKTGEWANLISGAIAPQYVIENWHDDIDLVGQRVVEYLGDSYDKRNMSLYRLSNGWLGWLPKSCVKFDLENENG